MRWTRLSYCAVMSSESNFVSDSFDSNLEESLNRQFYMNIIVRGFGIKLL
jgi:hypothetical protein